MQIFAAAWDAVMTKTVLSRFRMSKILSESQKCAIAEDGDPFKELEQEIENLRAIQLDLV